KGDLIKNSKTLFRSNLSMPVQISFTDSIILPGLQTEVTGSVQCDAFELSVLNPFIELYGWKLDGTLTTKFELSNTIEQLRINGPLSIKKGSIENKEYGIKYHQMFINSRFDNRLFKLNEFTASAGKGKIEMEGVVGFSPGIDFQIDTLNTRLKGRKFKVLNSREIEATIDADLMINGNQLTPFFDGDLKIIRSRINADALMEGDGLVTEDQNPPLLIQALNDTLEAQIFTEEERIARKRKEKDRTQLFIDHLKGECNIDIPKNTWITGRDMNFELAGDLKIIKTGIDFELFGDLMVRKGYYKLYGKKFIFDKGEVIFSGGNDWDPTIDFEIVYRFRNADRELKELQLNVSGKTSEPSLSFLLDDVALEEKEAISYLLMGRSLNKLSSGEQMSIEKDAASIAKNLALGQLSNLLQSKLQGSIPLDVIEISGDNQWGTGGVTIGKYLTNNLYLEYQRNFILDKKSKVVDPEKFSLEYKLFRYWFMQATNQRSNSGFDLFFKRSWK
ncbi:MAG: translocation/assembly module TamB, partial [Prolixibacteraceae bacterium]|nr:translocation/assembly module TamB [Prolixibacteraceae bacterium]